jgi:glycine betaine/proline transport system permease protein|tara:strand:- start:84 stop:953 length:870 start_codon:yes stop_codon:yes gene_type:complete
MNFPSLDKGTITSFKKSIDATFREFASNWGEWFTDLLSPLQWLLINFEKLLLATPWYVFLILVGFLIWKITYSWKLVLGFLISFVSIGLVGMWDDTMRTLAIVIVSTLVCVVIGIPTGILMAKNNTAQRIILPILDLMQTIPSFVYLIPVVMLFGLGKVPGLIAIVVFAIPPVIRFTNLGLRQVDFNLVETAQAMGLKSKYILAFIEIPLARNVILGGVNQTVMMALAMVVIASMIGVRGLGSQVMNSIGNGYLGLGVISGLSIVALAIIIDRTIQAHNKRHDKWRNYK